MRVGVVIPALNEEACIGAVVAECLAHGRPADDTRVVVCDNGSSDGTAAAGRSAGAEVVYETFRGYGAACLGALDHLGDWPEVVLFVDGDGSTDLSRIDALLNPIRGDQADLVIGWRRFAARGSMTLPQRLGSWWFSFLVNLRWSAHGHDLGPFRAVTGQALEKLCMSDRTWGWTLEMQIKALLHGLRVVEVPVGWRRRRSGASKISGTVSGVVRACGKISATFTRYVLCSITTRRTPRDLVVAFAKYPTPGCVQTRLAAAMGEVRAARIYRRLAERCFRQLAALQSSGLADVAVYGKGATTTTFRRWLPGARHYRPQPDCNLTDCLQRAFATAFARGARRAAAVGTDSPGLTAEAITQALGKLQDVDVVIIPNTDGGYALIGMNSDHPRLFENITWSTPSVLKQTRERACELDLRITELSAVSDVDTTDDLEHLPPLVSIIIPVRNEEQMLRRNLPVLMKHVSGQLDPFEVVVVDGGSTDGSRRVAEESGAQVISSSRGRGRQMNAGTSIARGDWLWYLHADCVPSVNAITRLCSVIQKHFLRHWGYFRARLDAPGIGFRTIEWGINLRSRWLKLPYGDQGIFVRRDLMQDLGGFVESQIMEDVDLVVRLARVDRPIVAAAPLLISARRWRQYGLWRTTWKNWRMIADHLVRRRDFHEIEQRFGNAPETARGTAAEIQEGAVI